MSLVKTTHNGQSTFKNQITSNRQTMKRILFSAALTCILAMGATAQEITKECKERAAKLVEQMTLDEKIDYISGATDGFHIRAIDRLGIPEIRMADGPQGVRNNTKSTLFACGVAAAATWNQTLAYQMGVSLGQDSRARGVHILLGPGVNIYRSPLCGRNFEYMGEDPYLAARTAVNYIEGVQSQGVMATIKHFALNNQEYDRHHVSSDADERTINEIYFPTFKAAVEEAHVGSVMTSYNLANNVHASASPFLIRENLKGKWAFDGFVMSDWTSTYSTLECIKGGLDLEMPGAQYFKKELIKPLIESGVVTEAEIDEKVCNILQTLIAFDFLDRPQLDKNISEDNQYSRETAYKMASESAVLLKNDGILPLKPGRRTKTVILGPNADVIPCGGGSGKVSPLYSISLYAGMQELGKNYPVQLVTPDENGSYDTPENVKAIESATTVIVVAGFNTKTEKENSDRTFTLPAGQDELISFAAAHNQNVVTVVYAGGGFDMSKWMDKVKAIVLGWYPGQEGGLALARMLAGEFSPSGRLPISIEAKWEDNPVHDSYYPKKKAENKRGFTNRYVTYSEGVFMGYRGYDRLGTKPLFQRLVQTRHHAALPVRIRTHLHHLRLQGHRSHTERRRLRRHLHIDKYRFESRGRSRSGLCRRAESDSGTPEEGAQGI
ncbi:putative beta-glucosidase [Bacteroides sp. CAG:545]|nr:putative beta-glucosidase [Bacteroides sp. CAG:545]